MSLALPTRLSFDESEQCCSKWECFSTASYWLTKARREGKQFGLRLHGQTRAKWYDSGSVVPNNELMLSTQMSQDSFLQAFGRQTTPRVLIFCSSPLLLSFFQWECHMGCMFILKWIRVGPLCVPPQIPSTDGFCCK